jgi:hypothetical protein
MNPRANPLLLASLVATLSLGCALAGESDKQVKELDLDHHVVYTIPVSGSRVTTISFPGPIAAIDAAAVTIDAKHGGSFHLAHTKGSYFFSVRSLVKEAVTNVNVRWNNKTYVLELQESRTPLLSVIFRKVSDAGRTPAGPLTPGRLLGLLDKAKAYQLLSTHHPEAVEKIDYRNFGDKPSVMEFGDFEVRLEEVFRFEPEDTLVFHVTLRNKTDKAIDYDARGFSVRIGERLFFQSISDASGTMPPKSDSPAYFAITGTADGGRNELSLKNEFTVLLTPGATEKREDDNDLPRSSQAGFKK